MQTKSTWNSALLLPLAFVLSLGPLCHLLGSQCFPLQKRCNAPRYSLPEPSSFCPHRVIGEKGREVASTLDQITSGIDGAAQNNGVAQ